MRGRKRPKTPFQNDFESPFFKRFYGKHYRGEGLNRVKSTVFLVRNDNENIENPKMDVTKLTNSIKNREKEAK